MYDDIEYGRFLLIDVFKKFIQKYDLPKELNVLVLGGSEEEPELKVLEELNHKIDFKLYGIENNENYLDLNEVNEFQNIDIDLILCSNVLEHVWNIENFFENIKKLCNKKTLVYINCPKSNIEHGSPEYYSAGYPKGFLIKNLENKGFNVLKAGEVGSERYYKSIHLLQSWYTKIDIEKKYRFKNNSLFFKIKHLSKLYNLGHFLSISKSSNNNHKSAFMTNSYIFSIRNK